MKTLIATTAIVIAMASTASAGAKVECRKVPIPNTNAYQMYPTGCAAEPSDRSSGRTAPTGSVTAPTAPSAPSGTPSTPSVPTGPTDAPTAPSEPTGTPSTPSVPNAPETDKGKGGKDKDKSNASEHNGKGGNDGKGGKDRDGSKNSDKGKN